MENPQASIPPYSIEHTLSIPHSKMDAEWRRWIGENLSLDPHPEELIKVLVANGFTRETASAEVGLALQYLEGITTIRNRLKKREWLLGVYRKNNRLYANTIEKRHKLSKEEFLKDYYSVSRPVIITGMMENWPAMYKWSPAFFLREFGSAQVDVQMGRNSGDNENRFEIEKTKYTTRMSFADYIKKVETSDTTNDFYVTGYNSSFNRQSLSGLWKDIVQIPEYLDNGTSRDGFFWFGPKGTITPFHYDLTNNFMAQVIGRKRVKIVPSWDMSLMQNHLHVFSKLDGRTMQVAAHPSFDEPQILECILNPGEILFLPIGCMHFVEGLDVSVTVSFTNFVFDNNDYASFYPAGSYENVALK